MSSKKNELLKSYHDLIEEILLFDIVDMPLSKQILYMVSISIFVSTKENYIKKDIENLYYDDTNFFVNKMFLGLYNSLKNTLRVTIDDKEETLNEGCGKVILTSGTDNIELKNAVWYISKIKDAFCHGDYDFSQTPGVIQIESNFPNGTGTFDPITKEFIKNIYHFKCNVELAELNYFTSVLNGAKKQILLSEITPKSQDRNNKKQCKLLRNQIGKYTGTKSAVNIAKHVALMHRLESIEKIVLSNRVDLQTDLIKTLSVILGKEDNTYSIAEPLLYCYLLLLLGSYNSKNNLIKLEGSKKKVDTRFFRNVGMEYDYPQNTINIVNILKKNLRILSSLMAKDFELLNNQIPNRECALNNIYRDFNKFFKSTLDNFEEINRENLRNIRNSVSHRKIDDLGNSRMLLKDGAFGKVSFICRTNPIDLFAYSEQVIKCPTIDTYTPQIFIEEISNILINSGTQIKEVEYYKRLLYSIFKILLPDMNMQSESIKTLLDIYNQKCMEQSNKKRKKDIT